MSDDKRKIDKVLRKAKILSMCWTTPGQPLDSKATCSAIEDVHTAICELYGVDPARGFRFEESVT